MAKAIIKEIILVILILAVIVLLFGIIFYDYIPSSKVIPSVISYKTPENVSNELADYSSEVGQQNVMVSYSIDGQDLSVYEQSNEYTKGKQNPFAASESSADDQAATNTASTNTATTNNNNSSSKNQSASTSQTAQNNNTNNGSTGTFYKDTGMK